MPVALALADIVRDMRDVPRDCFMDRAEMIHWLNRMARRVEGVATMKAPTSPRIVRRPLAIGPAPTRALAAHQQAEVVFGSAPKSSTKPVERRTVTSRKGRAVPVEVRKARQHGQMEFGL